MEYRRVGRSGLVVSELSFGAATFGASGDFFGAWADTGVDEAREMVDMCLDAGITLFDTADVYSDGASETVLGRALDGRRDRALISTRRRSAPRASISIQPSSPDTERMS